MIKNWIAAISFLLLSSAIAFADGGVLKYTSISPNDATQIWPIDFGGVGTENTAEIRLEDGTKIEGASFNFLWGEKQCNGLFTDENPPRLIVDGNWDGVYQTNETYTGEKDATALSPNQKYVYHNVRFPVTLGSDKESSYQYTIEASVNVSDYTSFTSAEIKHFQNHFEGDVLVGDSAYPARIVVRALNSYQNLPKTLVFLDTNNDGQFHPIDDAWFSSEGAAYIDGSLWSVSTTFREGGAELSITPYEGTTGTLVLEGDGVAQIGVRVPNPTQTVNGKRSNRAFDFSLHRRDDQTYTVPAESLEFIKIWLSANEQSDIVYQWPIQTYNQASRFNVESNKETTQYVGGPLSQSITVYANWLVGRLTLSNKGCKNREGMQFVALSKSDIVSQASLPAPSWEIRDRRGEIVRSGRFAYG